ncbi:MAG: hypothetical protein ACK5RO_00375 [Pseudobdellovibrionaceae bacterium]|jgi:hypothetical protein
MKLVVYVYIAAALVVGMSPIAKASICGNVHNSGFVSNPEVDWRKDFSFSLIGGKPVRSSPQREREMASEHKAMVDEIMGKDKDTPHLRFFAEDGILQTEIAASKYLSGMTPRVEVKGVQGNTLRATVMLPVSGHAGTQNAIKWAKEDLFTVSVSYGEKGPRTHQIQKKELALIVNKFKSLDLVTVLEIEIPLMRNTAGDLLPVNLYYHRLGLDNYLGAPEGYWEGRVLTIVPKD